MIWGVSAWADATVNVRVTASKGAVNALTYMAAVQLAPHGINVNAICPGLVETDLMRSVFDKR